MAMRLSQSHVLGDVHRSDRPPESSLAMLDVGGQFMDLRRLVEEIFSDAVEWETDAFVFHYMADDQDVVRKDLADRLEGALPRITADLGRIDSGKIHVYVYPTLEQFHRTILMPEVPEWVVGRALGRDQLHIVSPANPGPMHDTDSLLTIAVHELAHCITWSLVELTLDFPMWLYEGVALYYAGQYRNPKTLPYIKTRSYPSLETLSDQRDLQAVEYVYDLGYTLVEFIIEHYGATALVDLLKSRGSIETAIGVSRKEFEDAWHRYIEDRYLADEWLRDAWKAAE